MIRKAGKLTGLLVIEAVSALLIGLVVLAALFFWRLSTGPVKVDFLTPWIEQTLNDAETGVRVEIGDTVLNWGGSAQELEPGASTSAPSTSAPAMSGSVAAPGR